MEVFIDTNILVYAHDADAGARHQKAKDVVVAELHVNLVRKLKDTVSEAAEIAALYLDHWRVVATDASLIHNAWEIQMRWQLSFWDAQMIAAAVRANASEIWTEDLNHGQDYGGVIAVNPFQTFSKQIP